MIFLLESIAERYRGVTGSEGSLVLRRLGRLQLRVARNGVSPPCEIEALEMSLNRVPQYDPFFIPERGSLFSTPKHHRIPEPILIGVGVGQLPVRAAVRSFVKPRLVSRSRGHHNGRVLIPGPDAAKV